MDVKLGRYRHFKGMEYRVVGEGVNTETYERYIIYHLAEGNPAMLWVRPSTMFDDSVKNLHGNTVRRFEYIGE